RAAPTSTARNCGCARRRRCCGEPGSARPAYSAASARGLRRDDEPDRVALFGGEPLNAADHVVERHDVGDRARDVEPPACHEGDELVEVRLVVSEMTQQRVGGHAEEGVRPKRYRLV